MPTPEPAPFTEEILEWLLWSALVHVVSTSHGLLNYTLLTDAARFAIGADPATLHTGTRFCPVEIVSGAHYAIDHAPEALRPRMRAWVARHERELDRTQSSADRPWRTVAAQHNARLYGLPLAPSALG